MSSKGKMFNYIIYHKGCVDGFSGFFVAYMSGRLSNDVFIYADVPSAKNIPPNVQGKDIIIIDVAYKREVLEEIVELSKSVVFIDHHVSIAEDVRAIKKANMEKLHIVYDDQRSGATLAWMYFNSRQVAPLFLKYVEDQDVGRWEFENTKPFSLSLHSNYHLSTDPKSLQKWFRLLNKDYVLQMVDEGKIMQKYLIHLININLPRHSVHMFPSKKIYHDIKKTETGDVHLFKKPAQYKIALFSGHCPSTTDLAVEALERIECDFVMMWSYNLDKGEYVISMRSREVDISAIAKAFGGGGHKLAAAFSFPKRRYEIDDLFEGDALPRLLKPAEGVADS